LVAFLGPSLPAAEALRLAPQVELWPPICQGDLSTALERSRPAAILIVDGEFSQNLSVWHKEILHALHLGVRVIGASSMGALRAAELDRFGMEGVGEIYAYYRDGWLTADADVAVLHADAEEDYRPLTWPLVNVRATIAKLQAEDRLAGNDAAAILAVAERLHFTQRNRQTIARGLSGDAMTAERAAALARLLADQYVDQKALDAIAGFERLARLDEIPAPRGEEPLFRTGRGFEPLLWSDVEVQRANGKLRRYQLVADAALYHEDFDGLNERAANRYLVEMLAHEMGVEVTRAEIAEQRALTLARLECSEESLDDWLAANDTDAAHFARLVEQQALNARMRRWLVGTRLYERNRRLVIEQLQLEGGYTSAADAAARRRRLADCRPTPDYPLTDEAIMDLVVRQMAVSEWKVRGGIVEFADDQGFETVAGLLVALADSATANAELQQRRRRVARALGIDSDPSAATARTQPTPPMTTHALLEAHQVTHVLLTAIELGVPGALADGARTTGELALATKSDPGRLKRLLRALRAVRIVTREGDRWELTAEGNALITTASGHGEPLAAYGEHVGRALFATWAGLAEVIRGASPPPYPDDELSDRGISAAWEALGLTDTISRAVELPDRAHVADIGGGLGGLARRLIDGRPDITLSLVELPATAKRAATALADHPQVRVIALDSQRQLQPPADRCVLARVIMTLDDAAAIEVLRFVRRSLTDEGRIEIFDLDDDGTAAAAFADLVNLARSGGAVRSRAQWDQLARAAELTIVRRRSLAGPFVVVTMEPAPVGAAIESAGGR
jgi:hypothetical protein